MLVAVALFIYSTLKITKIAKKKRVELNGYINKTAGTITRRPDFTSSAQEKEKECRHDSIILI